MSNNGNKIELPASIVIRDLAQKIEKSPIDLIKKLMSNGVMATINQSVDFDTAAIVVAVPDAVAPELAVDIVVERSAVVAAVALALGADDVAIPRTVSSLG